MRYLPLVVLFCVGSSLAARAGDGASSTWKLWKKGQLASIWLDQDLYRDTHGGFYIHVQVRNSTDGEVGIDLQHPDRLVYPNQWTCDSEPERSVVDERWLPFPGPSEAERQALLARYGKGQLRKLLPGETTDFYARFNGTSGSDAVDRSRPDGFLIVSISGGVWVTDGSRLEALGRDAADNTDTDRAWSLPVVWRSLPASATLAPKS